MYMIYIKSLAIKSFRGISSLQLNELSPINILTGDNNSGKTSVLEVLQSYSNPENFRIWGTVLRKNINRAFPLSSYSYYEGIYDLFDVNKENKCIEYTVEEIDSEIGMNVENIRLNAEITEEELTESEYEKIQGFSMASSKTGDLSDEFVHNVNKMELRLSINDELKAEGYIFEGQRKIEDNKKTLMLKSKRNIVYISPSRHTEADVYLTDILKYPDLYEGMLEILKDYDEDIISINYDNDEKYRPSRGVYKILSKSYKEALPFNVYGDGMKKAILLMSAVLKAQNGILLLDEFETAIHTSAMDRTFRWILETCLKLNVQVFLTSHSKEAIDKVLKCSEKVRNHTALYTLYKEDDKITVRRLTGDKAVEVQDEMGLELR